MLKRFVGLANGTGCMNDNPFPQFNQLVRLGINNFLVIKIYYHLNLLQPFFVAFEGFAKGINQFRFPFVHTPDGFKILIPHHTAKAGIEAVLIKMCAQNKVNVLPDGICQAAARLPLLLHDFLAVKWKSVVGRKHKAL